MPPAEHTLCEICHARHATHHVCYGGTGKSSNLCDQCFQTSTPIELREYAAAARDAHCQYCGGQPCAGGTDVLALITGVQQMRLMCMPCTTEYQRYTEQKMTHFSTELTQEEQLTAIRKLLDQADTHMKKWVAERK